MVKKLALASLAVVLVFTMVSLASAAPNVTNTNHKGSLLVYPKIVVFDNESTTADVEVDTYVFIGNDQTSGVYVKCYWMDNAQQIQDFQFYLTASQPAFFRASDGWGSPDIGVPPFWGVGSLVCFAEDNNDQNEIKWNHLYGSATIVTIEGGSGTSAPPSAAMYNAWAFVAGSLPTSSGQLVLDGGNNYDSCPSYLVENFWTSTFNGTRNGLDGYQESQGLERRVRPDLTLWPCKQDLRQDRYPTCTKAKFDVWNENEVKFTGAYQCFRCFYEGFLDEVGKSVSRSLKVMNHGWPDNNDTTQLGNGFGWDKFTYYGLSTDFGRFRVQGIASSVCKFNDAAIVTATGQKACSGTVATPLLGVLLYAQEFVSPYGSPDPTDKSFGQTTKMTSLWPAKVVNVYTGSPLHFAGTDTTGLIQWDPAGGVVEAAGK